MINAPITGDALARGLRSEFANTYEDRYQGIQQFLGPMMELGVDSDKFEELYGYYETAPHPQHRRWGEEVPTGTFRARTFTVKNRAWDISVHWYKHQRIFEQLRMLESHARTSGDHFAILDERVFFQMIQGTVDTKLLPSVPLAPDGAAIYSATDGAGAARFGITGGNTVTTSGVASADAVRDDFFDALEQMMQFQDTQGQILHDPGIFAGGITVLYGAKNLKVFNEAFNQGLTALAPATATSNAAVSNIVNDAGFSVTPVATARITDDRWYVFLNNMDPKPVFMQLASPLEEFIQVEDNSDQSRLQKIEGIFFEVIKGYGANLPLGTIRVA